MEDKSLWDLWRWVYTHSYQRINSVSSDNTLTTRTNDGDSRQKKFLKKKEYTHDAHDWWWYTPKKKLWEKKSEDDALIMMMIYFFLWLYTHLIFVGEYTYDTHKSDDTLIMMMMHFKSWLYTHLHRRIQWFSLDNTLMTRTNLMIHSLWWWCTLNHDYTLIFIGEYNDSHWITHLWHAQIWWYTHNDDDAL